MILSDNELLRILIIQAVIDKHLRCRVAPLSLFSPVVPSAEIRAAVNLRPDACIAALSHQTCVLQVLTGTELVVAREHAR